MTYCHEQICDILETHNLYRKGLVRPKEYDNEQYLQYFHSNQRYFLNVYRNDKTRLKKRRKKKRFIISEAPEIAVLGYIKPSETILYVTSSRNLLKNTNLFCKNIAHVKNYCREIQMEDLFLQVVS